MEIVTIERSALEWLTRYVLEMNSYDGLDIAHESDRITALNAHKAIEALGISEQLQAEAMEAREKMWAELKADREAKEKAEAKAAKAGK
ncbi:hypothetical protein N9262_02200 [Akkermansiaceae bacterium]|nr:hypothetical protein [Akkermansiaceae bacterium]